MFKNIGIKGKMLGLCLLMAILTGVVGTVGCLTLKKVVETNAHIAKANMPNLESLLLIRLEQKDMVISVTRVYDGQVSPAELKELRNAVKVANEKIDEQVKSYESLPFADGEEEAWKDTKKDLIAFRNLVDKMLDLSTGDKEEAKQRDSLYLTEFVALRKRVVAGQDKLLSMVQKEADTWTDLSEKEGARGIYIIITLSVCSFIFSLAFGYFFSSGLAKSIKAIADQLFTGAREVSGASNQISESGAQLASSSTEQASALQQTVASIDEISAMVAKNADNAKRSQDTAATSHQAASKGKQSVEQMMSSIDDISKSNADIMQQVNASNQEISGIVKIIAEIGNKTKVINDIVFQTKLLSFNASVEAARAGEHGKGFAVVAEEVGNLAQMSGNAAKEISQMLEESISKVESTVNSTKTKVESLMNAGKQKVEAGITTAQRCGEALDEIVENVNNLTLMVNEIATASREQSQGVQEITKAMGQLDQVTQENAAASQQAASASEELNGQAAALHNSVSQLVKMVQGGDAQLGQNTAAQQTPTTPVQTKLLPFKKKHETHAFKNKAKMTAAQVQPKMAAGSDIVPSEDDPRFKDI